MIRSGFKGVFDEGGDPRLQAAGRAQKASRHWIRGFDQPGTRLHQRPLPHRLLQRLPQPRFNPGRHPLAPEKPQRIALELVGPDSASLLGDHQHGVTDLDQADLLERAHNAVGRAADYPSGLRVNTGRPVEAFGVRTPVVVGGHQLADRLTAALGDAVQAERAGHRLGQPVRVDRSVETRAVPFPAQVRR